jgi:hypothetical protein
VAQRRALLMIARTLFMSLFVRAHHGRQALAAATIVIVVGVWTTGNVVSMPQLLQGLTQPIDVSLLLALAYAPIVAYSFGSDAIAVESVSRRRLLSSDLALLTLMLAPSVIGTAAMWATGNKTGGLTLFRDCAAFIGISLALLSIAPTAVAAALPMGYFLAMATLGLNADGSTTWWAWLRAPASLGAAGCALILVAVGVALFNLLARRRAARVASFAEA